MQRGTVIHSDHVAKGNRLHQADQIVISVLSPGNHVQKKVDLGIGTLDTHEKTSVLLSSPLFYHTCFQKSRFRGKESKKLVKAIDESIKIV